jgi:hypothetical protein
MTDSENRIAIVLSHQLGSGFVYPPAQPREVPRNHPEFISGKQELVARMNVILKEEIDRKILELSSLF